jgi:DNA-binding NarL/FixJ family response regulator
MDAAILEALLVVFFTRKAILHEGNFMTIPSQTTTVLLIDANDHDRQHWSERLRTSKAYTILEASNAETGLAICKSERIDCVITELHLPDMSGFQVLLRLNPLVHRSLHTPVIALSHFVLPSIIAAAKKLGVHSYLIKSQASAEDLDRAIQEAIARMGMTRKEVYRERSLPL